MNSVEAIKSLLIANRHIFADAGVDLIGLFGSYVSGGANENSDLDILIEPNGNKPVSIFSLIKLEDHLTEILGLKVDLAIKRSLRPKIGQRILQEVEYV